MVRLIFAIAVGAIVGVGGGYAIARATVNTPVCPSAVGSDSGVIPWGGPKELTYKPKSW